ncbi:hypothetical protein D3C81_1682140 [compost metagenome]
MAQQVGGRINRAHGGYLQLSLLHLSYHFTQAFLCRDQPIGRQRFGRGTWVADPGERLILITLAQDRCRLVSTCCRVFRHALLITHEAVRVCRAAVTTLGEVILDDSTLP